MGRHGLDRAHPRRPPSRAGGPAPRPRPGGRHQRARSRGHRPGRPARRRRRRPRRSWCRARTAAVRTVVLGRAPVRPATATDSASAPGPTPAEGPERRPRRCWSTSSTGVTLPGSRRLGEAGEHRSTTPPRCVRSAPTPAPATRAASATTARVTVRTAGGTDLTAMKALAEEDIGTAADGAYGKDAFGDRIHGGSRPTRRWRPSPSTVAGRTGYLVRRQVTTGKGPGGYVQSLVFPSAVGRETAGHRALRLRRGPARRLPLSLMDTITRGIRPDRRLRDRRRRGQHRRCPDAPAVQPLTGTCWPSPRYVGTVAVTRSPSISCSSSKRSHSSPAFACRNHTLSPISRSSAGRAEQRRLHLAGALLRVVAQPLRQIRHRQPVRARRPGRRIAAAEHRHHAHARAAAPRAARTARPDGP